MSTSHETGSTAIRKFDPENIGVAAGILSLRALAWCNFYLPFDVPSGIARFPCDSAVFSFRSNALWLSLPISI